MGLKERTPPSPADYQSYFERFSNWGRWGQDDELGTLNHITPEVRRRAAALVTEGRTVSVGRVVDTHNGPLNPYPAHYFRGIAGAGGVGEFIGLFFHGHCQTHIDSFSHMRSQDRKYFYNGVDPGPTGFPPDQRSSIHHWRNGIATRGVLYDIPRLRGTAYVEPGRPVQGWDLVDAAAAQGIEPRAGDAVIIRSGLGAYLQSNPNGFESRDDGNGALIPAGVHASALEFLYETDAALLCWDMLDAPTAQQGFDNPYPITTPVHVHAVAIPYLGLPLLDNADLEQLSAECATLGRWEFLFFVSPLIIEGGTGSPVNPIAML
jgi:kynurenine formamidase